jgi:hypothetical protein
LSKLKTTLPIVPEWLARMLMDSVGSVERGIVAPFGMGLNPEIGWALLARTREKPVSGPDAMRESFEVSEPAALSAALSAAQPLCATAATVRARVSGRAKPRTIVVGQRRSGVCFMAVSESRRFLRADLVRRRPGVHRRKPVRPKQDPA